jgi:8-oxo-dGTP pyrophosphatase MutT (NUDIX family)
MHDAPRIRRAVRAVVLDPDDRILLVRFDFPDKTVWAMPGGGIDGDESAEAALRRELAEEVGLDDPVIGPPLWTRTHLFAFEDGSHDGQTEVIHLVRSPAFAPEPAWSWEELHCERVTDVRWWAIDELLTSDNVFSPRSLPALVATLVAEGPPPEPFDVGV